MYSGTISGWESPPGIVGWFKILKFDIYILLKVAPVPYIILYFMAKFEAIKTKSRGRYDLQLL